MSQNAILQLKPLGFPWETQDPFIFCVYHRDEYPKGNDSFGPEASLAGRNIGQDFVVKDGWRMYHGQHIPGFPYHPHRGFETITVVKEGIVDHTDSLGAAGRFGSGDVQWMTAGKGVQHSEMFPLLNKDTDNTLEIFQIWLNLPKASKFVEPHFKMLWKDKIPLKTATDNQGKRTEVNVIAGSLRGIHPQDPTPNSWAADPLNEVAVWTIKIEAQGKWVLPSASEHIHRTIYFYKGDDILLEEKIIPVNHSVQLKPDQEIKIKAGKSDAYLLLLQGKPINEPVVQHGPFVMNTEAEIREAFQDFQETQFGGWPWPDHEQVHPREKGRFALHADGREEIQE
jgi:redox-sensitive bicupin YhaK (pirin superfamily)